MKSFNFAIDQASVVALKRSLEARLVSELADMDLTVGGFLR